MMNIKFYSKCFVVMVLSVLVLGGCGNMSSGSGKGKLSKKIDKLIDTGNYNEAYIEITSQMDEKNADIDTKLSLGWIYNYQKEYDKAIAVLKEVISKDSNNEEAYFVLAVVYMNQKEFEEALETFEKTLELEPTNDKVYSHMASIYLEQKNFEKAEWAYKKAIEVNPLESIYFLSLSDLYFKQEKFNLAKLNCEKALQLAPADDKERIEQTLRNIELREILKNN